MKNLIISISVILICFSSCDNDEKLEKAEAIQLLNKNYPQIKSYDIFCGDPDFVRKPEIIALEQNGYLVIKKTRKLNEPGSPLIILSDKSRAFQLKTTEEEKLINIQKVKLAEEKFKEIEAITLDESGKKAVVAYTTTYGNITPFSALVKTDFTKEMSNSISLSLTDKGWQIDPAK